MLKRLLLIIALVLNACGGGPDSASMAPGGTPPSVSVALAVTPGPKGYFGSFYGEYGVVVVDARVIATARVDPGLPPGGRLFWDLVEAPVGSMVTLVPQDPLAFSEAFVPDIVGTYRVQAIGDYVTQRTAPAFADVKVIPHHIEFVVDVTQSPDSTLVVIHSGVTRPLRRALSTRGIATAEAFLDGGSLGVLTSPNGRIDFAVNAHPSFEGTYNYTLDRQSLGTAPHTLRVVLTDVEGLAREGALNITAGADTQAAFFGF